MLIAVQLLLFNLLVAVGQSAGMSSVYMSLLLLLLWVRPAAVAVISAAAAAVVIQ